jgi:3-oxoacyl-[acyl-carrier-protein] synthase II
MSGPAPADRMAITGCGVLSPAGLGLQPLAACLRGEPVPQADPAHLPAGEPLPEGVRAVPGFDTTAYLGRRGTRYLDRTTALGLVAARLAMQDAESAAAESASWSRFRQAASAESASWSRFRQAASADPPHWAGAGVVVGTSTGSVRSSSEFSRDTFVQKRPYLVDAAAFPNTVMNCCAGQIAIWNGLHGVNATIAGGHASGLFAIRYARNALVQGHAPRLVVGAVEELCAQSAWAWRRTGALTPQTTIGEGCAFFVLGDAPQGSASSGRPPLGTVLACEVGFVNRVQPRQSLLSGLAGCVGRALHRSGVSADQVAVVSLGATGLVGLERVEERAVRRVLDGRPAQLIRVREVVGECYSAGAALQLAALLSLWREDSLWRAGPAGQVGLVTSIGLDGNVGCLVVRAGG